MVQMTSECWFKINDDDINDKNSAYIYFINIFGNKILRKNLKNGVTIVMKPRRIDDYLSISIKGFNKKMHHLSAKTFINPLIYKHMHKPSVDHIDGNGLNNHWTNLRWIEKDENASMHHALPNPKIQLSSITSTDASTVSFNSIMSKQLNHTYVYDISNKQLYMMLKNGDQCKLVNGITRYEFRDKLSKNRFTICLNKFHNMMLKMVVQNNINIAD